MFTRYLQRAIFQRLCVLFNMLMRFLYTADKLNVSFGTILRGDSKLNLCLLVWDQMLSKYNHGLELIFSPKGNFLFVNCNNCFLLQKD